MYYLQIEYEEKKKAEGKRSRDDKNAVMEMLFKAFDKHQYYNIKDLVNITKQPVVSDHSKLKIDCIAFVVIASFSMETSVYRVI